MKNKLLVLLVAIITGFGIVRAESIDLLDSTVTVNESSVFGHSKTVYQYNSKGSFIRQTRIYATWSKWKVGVPMIMNRRAVFVYDDEGHEIDLYYSSLDTATGKWTDDHRYLYDEWHNRTYSVGKWNADSTALLSGVRYFYDSNHFLIGNESFDTWNGVEVVTDKYFYTNNANGYKISMYGQFRPDSAYDGDYKSDPDKFNQSGWKNVDSAYYERNAAGQSIRETFFRWDESNNQWLKDGHQDFTYDAQGHLLTDTVFARDFETNIITYNNMTVREYDSYGNLTRTTTYSPVVSESETQWQVNDVSVNEYTYNEKGLITLKRSHTDYNDGAEPNYSTTTYYYSHYDLDENGNIVPEPCLIASGTCGAQGDNLTWELSCDSVLTITGTGAMADYDYAPWYNDRESILSVVIENDITSIGNYAFEGCTGLTSVTIPNSVTSIGDSAFVECSSLTCVHISDLAAWCGIGFDGGHCNPLCYAHHLYLNNIEIKELVIPNSVTSIGNWAFYNCSGLTSVTIPNSVTSIEDDAFRDCTGLTSITCEAITPPTLGYFVFFSVDKSIPLYVPAESIDLYKAADQWKDFTNILPIGGHPSLSLPIHIELKDNYGRWLAEAAISNDYDTAFFESSSFYYSEHLVYAYKAEDNLWRLIGHTTPEYRFIGWKDKDGKVLNQDTLCLYSSDTVTAVVSKQEYHVQVVPDNTMHGYTKAEYGYAADTTISYGESINVTAIPREGFQFNRWSDGNTDNPREIRILGDLYMTAIFECKSYGGGGPSNLMDTITIERGDPVVISEGFPWQRTIYPNETGYFNDTLLTIFGCDSIVTHYVIVTENKFPVIFLNYNGKVLSRQYIRNGMGAEEPEVPAREGYTFTGWTTDIEHIIDTTYAIAVYDKIGGTLTYLSEEGDVIATENVDLHLPAAPIIAGKSFKGWLTESADAENGIVLRATYTFDNPTTHDDVTITPSSNSAYVIFPFITGALTYQLVIRDLFGNVVCKIMFSATGHLLGIAFAPSRNRESQQATQTTGFNFTVEGLDANTTYEYEFVANDETDEVIETLSGSFTTKAENPTDNEQVNTPPAVRKYLEDGHLMIDANSHIFDTQGKIIK